LKLVNTIIVNTKGEGQQSGEDFWVKAEKLYYTALIAYIWYEAPEEEQNFAMLIDMIDASEAREDDENFKNAVDLLFDELEAKNPNHFAVRQYKKYKLAADVLTYKRLVNQTSMEIARADLAALPETERKILSLVANRLLCATGEKQLFETVKAELSCSGHLFSVSGKSVTHNG
jgi:type IV secretion system protein VirD4